ncbi:hypothetical protein [Streptomyces sp. WAC01280]|uniref:hypothetical protein n=1 Tax=Streptomyces sp. WAC01280 TaxID=2487424 RepID=UPI000F79B00C|nr:hypothetical protein [Streptomyces sp. WAC01280]RSS57470.1 hypothetical protein EF909_16135 [Streptomyces sp. WAC01280]
MTHAFHSDAAEKILAELTAREQAAVESVRRSLEEQPGQGRSLPGTDTLAVEILPEQTGGRGLSVVYRHDADLDAVLILWLIAGP